MTNRNHVCTYLLLTLAALAFLGPLAWMISTSFKTTREAMASPPVWLPWRVIDARQLAAWQADPTRYKPELAGAQSEEQKYDLSPDMPAWEQRWHVIRANYFGTPDPTRPGEFITRGVLTDPNFGGGGLYARNTLIIAGLTTLGSVLSCSLVAYSLARLNWYGKNLLFGVVIATMMIPFPVLMVPLYRIFKAMGLLGTNVPLWLPAFFGAPFFIFLFRQFYLTIPAELSDAARIDGCSDFGIWWRVILPLSRPVMAVVALFAFMGSWNDFLGPLVYLTSQKQFTLSLVLQFFQSRNGGTSWELLMAASLLVITPVVILFFLAQRQFIEGIATSGMKG